MALQFLNNGYFAGKVGIGTDSPSSTLTISSSVGGDGTWNKSGILIENTSTTTGEPTLAFRNAGTTGTGANYWHTGLNQSNTYKIAYGTSFTDGNTKFELSTGGVLRLNSYTQGFLQTDANGNVGLSGGGTLPGGPYLPISAGSSYPLTGDLFIEGGSKGLRINNSTQPVVFLGDGGANTDGQLILYSSEGVANVLFNGDNQNHYIANGNLGIGTSSPTKTLNVEFNSSSVEVNSGEGLSGGSAGTGVLLQNTNATEGTFANLDFRANNVDARIAVTHNTTNSGDFHFILDNTAATPTTRLIIEGETGNVGIGTTSPTSLLEVSQQLSAASTIDYPYTISSRDDGNSINQGGGEGVGIKFRIAGNAATTPGDSLVGASIAAIRETSSDTDSSTGLGFFVTQNDETLDEALRIDHDRNANFLSNVNITNSLDVTNTIDIGTQAWKNYTSTPAKLNVEVAGGRAINIYNTAEDAAYLSFIDSQSDDGQYANLSFNSDGNNAFIINNMGYQTTINNVGIWTFSQVVSGITPTADANFVTKAYADGLTPGAGVFLPLTGGTLTGGLIGTTGEFSDDVSALRFNMNPGYAASAEYMSISKAQNQDGGILLKSKVTDGSGQLDWQILNHGTTGDLRFYAYGLAGNSLILDRANGNATFGGNIYLQDTVNPTIFFNGSSDATIDFAIKSTPEGLDFIEPEQSDKIHFQILDDTGVNAVFGYRLAGTMVIDTSRNLLNMGTGGFSGTVTAPTFSGDLSGTINTVTTAVTKPNATNDTTVATTAFVKNLIGEIPAGLAFEGTWDADTDDPDLSVATPNNGQFWVVSVSGSTDLSGITDWKVGDWAIWVEDGTGADAWQKVDNSSVLDGQGTGQTIPLWSGSGNSNTLTDSVVTQDSTNIGIGIAIPLHKLSIESDDNSLIKIRNTTNAGGASIEFNDNNGSTDTQNGQITYYHSDTASQGGGASFWFEAQPDTTLVVGNGTNTGRVVVGGNSATEVGYGFYDDVNTGMFKPTNHQLGFATNGTNRLTIASSAADFAVPIKTITGTAAIPSLQIGDSDSGFYDSGANLISVSLGGVQSATFHPGGRFQAVSSIQAGDDTNTAGASRVGAMRYRTGTEYVEVTGTELIPQPLDFTDGWDSIGSTTTITADTFVTVTSAGGVRKPTFLTVGQVYRLKISGTTTSTNNQINNYANNSNYKTWSGAGAFDFTFTFTATTDGGLYLRLYPGTAEIYSLSVMEVTEEDASYADMCMQTGASEYEWVNIVRNTY